MKIDIPKALKTKQEVFKWLKENEDDIVYQKKSELKKADGFTSPTTQLQGLETTEVLKDGTSVVTKADSIPGQVKVRAIINTTMVRDSHKDVHITGLWKKSLKENKRLKHLQEHKMTFASIIADKDDLKAFTKTYSWKDLGYNVEGETEALVFDSTIKETRNNFMYHEYKNENVDNHSVGMYYVDMKMAMNSDAEGDEKYKAVYDKYINDIANKDEVERDGFFFAVLEAKAIEGSAVPIGSNQITPTITTSKTKKELSDIQKTEVSKALEKWLKG